MTHETISDEFSNEPTILNYINQKYKLKPLIKISKGHTGAILYICQNPEKARMVVKFGLTDLSREEVRNNIYGYEGIKSAGGKDLLPPNIAIDNFNQLPIIIMDYLGSNMAELTKQTQQPSDVFDIFIKSIKTVSQQSIALGNQEQVAGIDVIKSQIKRWWKPIIHKGLLPREAENILDKVDSESLSSNHSGLEILDFTPDNFFIFNGRVIFIDPWKQTTYRGSLLPGLGQFVTLSKDIYDLQGIRESEESLQNLIGYTGSLLELEQKQIDGQIKLGSALQFGLSSFVRLESDPKLALDFASRSYRLVQSI